MRLREFLESLNEDEDVQPMYQSGYDPRKFPWYKDKIDAPESQPENNTPSPNGIQGLMSQKNYKLMSHTPDRLDWTHRYQHPKGHSVNYNAKNNRFLYQNSNDLDHRIEGQGLGMLAKHL